VILCNSQHTMCTKLGLDLSPGLACSSPSKWVRSPSPGSQRTTGTSAGFLSPLPTPPSFSLIGLPSFPPPMPLSQTPAWLFFPPLLLSLSPSLMSRCGQRDLCKRQFPSFPVLGRNPGLDHVAFSLTSTQPSPFLGGPTFSLAAGP
jgi:hypothetical protein